MILIIIISIISIIIQSLTITIHSLVESSYRDSLLKVARLLLSKRQSNRKKILVLFNVFKEDKKDFQRLVE